MQVVEMGSHRVDKPEPRWQALLAFVAVAGIYLALPSSLIVGPTWLLPTLIGRFAGADGGQSSDRKTFS